MAASKHGEFEGVDESYAQVSVFATEGATPKYTVFGHHDDMSKKPDEIPAGALNLNGFGMATKYLEIGEHKQPVRIERNAGSKYVNIIVEEPEE